MQHITDINELKALGREKGFQLLAYKEQNKTLFKFIQRLDHQYINGDQVLVIRLIINLGW